MEDKKQHLLQPLLQPIANTKLESQNDSCNNIPSSNASIILRFVVVIFAGVVSLWANYEASKGFAISIVHQADDTLAKRRFDLFFVSNDEATRLVLKTSKFVEDFIYPSDDFSQLQQKKQLKHVILQLSSRNLSRPVIVESRHNDEFVLHVSPSIMDSPSNYKQDMFLAVQKGMARIWLWDGQGNAPPGLVNGMVEYFTARSRPVEPVELGRGSCWKGKNPRAVANFLNYCDGRRRGFVRRLNQAMKNGWHEKMIDDALGMPVWHVCETYRNSSRDMES